MVKIECARCHNIFDEKKMILKQEVLLTPFSDAWNFPSVNEKERPLGRPIRNTIIYICERCYKNGKRIEGEK